MPKGPARPWRPWPLATLTLVVPTFTTTVPGPEFSSSQLAFAAIASLVLYVAFVLTQTVRHRDFFLPVTSRRRDRRRGAAPPTDRDHHECGLVGRRFGCRRRPREGGVEVHRGRSRGSGLPPVVCRDRDRLLVLLRRPWPPCGPLGATASRSGLNLAFGSAIASIGLTIPVIAVASIWLEGRSCSASGRRRWCCWP